MPFVDSSSPPYTSGIYQKEAHHHTAVWHLQVSEITKAALRGENVQFDLMTEDTHNHMQALVFITPSLKFLVIIKICKITIQMVVRPAMMFSLETVALITREEAILNIWNKGC